MPQLRFKSNTDKFLYALRAKAAATHKAYPEILNHAALNIAFRASSFTPKGDAGKIRASLMRDPHLRYALTSIYLKQHGLLALNSPQFAKEVARFVSRRASSASYLRSAWAGAVESLGGTFRGVKMRGAGEGFANKATVSRLKAEIVAILSQTSSKHAQSAETIMADAVDKAISYVADDMIQFANRRLQEAAKT